MESIRRSIYLTVIALPTDGKLRHLLWHSTLKSQYPYIPTLILAADGFRPDYGLIGRLALHRKCKEIRDRAGFEDDITRPFQREARAPDQEV